MARLVDGQWADAAYATEKTGGRFVRAATTFREQVELTEGDRYHLYVSLACPWAHRTLFVRALKGLEDAVPVSIVDPFMGDHGWSFSDAPGTLPDPVHGAKTLADVYLRADARFTGRVTVPVLFDKRRDTIVNNESADILRIFDRATAPLATRELPSLYPE